MHISAFVRAFKTPDVRKKLLFTLALMAIYRLGAHIPVPGVSYSLIQECQKNMPSAQGGRALLGLADMFSGGALLQLSIFALGIMPYITASIIVQLLTVVIPKFEALKKEGQAGQTKMTQYTRYLTIGLAVLQSSTFVTYARNPQGLFGPGCTSIMPDTSIWAVILMVLVMTAGTGLIMWMGELMTEKGIGNGMSLLIFTSICARFPQSLWGIKESHGWGKFLIVIAVGLAVIALVVFVEQSQRRIPVQYAKRMIGRRQYGGTSTYIPLKLNMANVIPIIFASSILALPVLVAQFQQDGTTGSYPGWAGWIMRHFAQGTGSWYAVTYAVLIVFFAFFYVSIQFNADEIAENMKKYGGFVPGYRAGRPTAEYLSYVINRITWPGSLYLAAVAMLPLIAFAGLKADQNFPFGGASIIIMVGVALETVKQIESKLQQHHYEGFLR